jgi:hypothetical protein
MHYKEKQGTYTHQIKKPMQERFQICHVAQRFKGSTLDKKT